MVIDMQRETRGVSSRLRFGHDVMLFASRIKWAEPELRGLGALVKEGNRLLAGQIWWHLENVSEMGERLVVVEPATVHDDAGPTLGPPADDGIDGQIGLADAGRTGHQGHLSPSEPTDWADEQAGCSGDLRREFPQCVNASSGETHHVLALPLPPSRGVPFPVRGVHRFDLECLLGGDRSSRRVQSASKGIESVGCSRALPSAHRVDDGDGGRTSRL